MKKINHFINLIKRKAGLGHDLGRTCTRLDSLSIVSRESDLDCTGRISALSFSRVWRYVGMIALLLTLVCANAWGDQNTAGKAAAGEDRAYVYTPNISTQDTLYLKHEDHTPSESWWSKNGGALIQSLAILILGAGITWITSSLDGRKEQKLKKQEKITDEAIAIEKDIYARLIDIRNAPLNQKENLLTDFAPQLQKAELTMRAPLYKAANNIYNYYLNITSDKDQVPQTEMEELQFEEYKALFNEQV